MSQVTNCPLIFEIAGEGLFRLTISGNRMRLEEEQTPGARDWAEVQKFSLGSQEQGPAPWLNPTWVNLGAGAPGSNLTPAFNDELIVNTTNAQAGWQIDLPQIVADGDRILLRNFEAPAFTGQVLQVNAFAGDFVEDGAARGAGPPPGANQQLQNFQGWLLTSRLAATTGLANNTWFVMLV